MNWILIAGLAIVTDLALVTAVIVGFFYGLAIVVAIFAGYVCRRVWYLRRKK